MFLVAPINELLNRDPEKRRQGNQAIRVGADRGINVTGNDALGVTGTRTTRVAGAVTQTYQAGALDVKTKELLGLVA